MNKLLTWAFAQNQQFPFTPETWTKATDVATLVPTFWNGPTASKIIGFKFPENFGPGLKLDPNKTTILGGICSIYTGDMERIRKKDLVFKNETDFHDWMLCWYPRIDQIHNTIGIPPKNCSEIMYVCEDSLFGRKLAKHTGLDETTLALIIKNLHEKQGHRVLCNWLESFGYKGKISVVYTSDIEKEMEIGLRFWERSLGFTFPARERDGAKVKMMYTGIWLDILGIKESAIIYEPADHMYLENYYCLKNWFRENNYGKGMNRNVGIAGFLPFWLSAGLSRTLEHNEINNFGKNLSQEIENKDLAWYVTNLLFTKKEVVVNGPDVLNNETARMLIKHQLEYCYQGN